MARACDYMYYRFHDLITLQHDVISQFLQCSLCSARVSLLSLWATSGRLVDYGGSCRGMALHGEAKRGCCKTVSGSCEFVSDVCSI